MTDDAVRPASLVTEEDLRLLRELKVKDRLHDLEVAYCRGSTGVTPSCSDRSTSRTPSSAWAT
ncbi:hypothetical protein ACR6C2_18010 [Streptomyces sp. INA 01156]